MIHTFDDLLGIPFKLGGRTKEGYDCYGFVIEAASRLGHKMIDLQTELSENNEKDLNNNVYNIVKSSKLKKTADFKYGNILMFFDTKGRICHIGLLLNKELFIHCDGEGVRITKLETYYRKWEMYEWQK